MCSRVAARRRAEARRESLNSTRTSSEDEGEGEGQGEGSGRVSAPRQHGRHRKRHRSQGGQRSQEAESQVVIGEEVEELTQTLRATQGEGAGGVVSGEGEVERTLVVTSQEVGGVQEVGEGSHSQQRVREMAGE